MTNSKSMNDLEILLHSGGPKTGSGSIQRFYSKDLPALFSSQGISRTMPFALLSQKPGGVGSANMGKLTNPVMKGIGGGSNQILSEVIVDYHNRRLSNGLPNTLVISAENAGYPALTFAEASRLAELLKEHTIKPIKVVYYVRPLMDLSLSLIAQNIKAAASFKYARSIAKRLTGDHCARKYCYFRHLYGNQVYFYPFGRGLLHGADVRLDFASKISSKELANELQSFAQQVPSSNAKINLPILKILRQLYASFSLDNQNRPPTLFNQFITEGQWEGSSLVHRDLFSSAVIQTLYANALEEAITLQHIGLPQGFEMLDLDGYMQKNENVCDANSYNSCLTEIQLCMLRSMVNGLKHLSPLAPSGLISSIDELAHSSTERPYGVSQCLHDILEATLLIENG